MGWEVSYSHSFAELTYKFPYLICLHRNAMSDRDILSSKMFPYHIEIYKNVSRHSNIQLCNLLSLFKLYHLQQINSIELSKSTRSEFVFKIVFPFSLATAYQILKGTGFRAFSL